MKNLFNSLGMHKPPLERAGSCTTHGTFTSLCHMGTNWTKCPTCAAERRATEETAALETQKRNARAKWELSLKTAAIPERFLDRSLDNYQPENDLQRYALEKACNYADLFAGGLPAHSLVLSGNPGTGKTHLAIGIAKRIMSRQHCSVHFTTVGKMVRRVREAKSYSAEENESEVLAVYTFPDLLILDEVGLQSGTDAEARTLFDVINERYEQRKPSLLLTNEDLEGVKKAIGPRLFDRLREDGSEVITFEWESYRARKAA